mmetsp:Transcript_19503/g.44409  ORF Transcript_19503/g.44409 Transcript_19503/m.44409 type:complete len:208 (-) Transcript_19503:263-886(-)
MISRLTALAAFASGLSISVSAFSISPIAGVSSRRAAVGYRSSAHAMEFMTHYEEIKIETDHAMSVQDITAQVEAIVAKSGCMEGTVTVLSKHSTLSVSINELEGRLVDDIRQFFLTLAPPNRPYLHNDLDYRVGPEDWPGGDEAWREFRRTQPVNTHSHLIAMMLGTSECIPISGGAMTKGKYQSILAVDIDGPKSRGLGVQITGGK